SVSGKGVLAVGLQGLLPVADEVLVEAKAAGGLGDGVALLADELDGLGLDLGGESASLPRHDGRPRVILNPYLSEHHSCGSAACPKETPAEKFREVRDQIGEQVKALLASL